MQTFVAVFFLGIVVALFSPTVQAGLKSWFHKARWRVFVVPCGLTALFAAVLAAAGVRAPAFLALVAAYTFLPAALVYANGPGQRVRPWLDCAAILLLWLPIELAAGRELLPRASWAVANIAARGTAISLALFLFLICRDFKGMKYNLPRKSADLLYPAIGFAVAAPVLILLGRILGFMGPYRGAAYGPAAFALLWLKTLAGVALPEELLFRSLIQNWIMQRFGFHHLSLLAAALVFGASHLNNPPGPLPNWRYMILASIAGFVFGKVFWKSSTILSSAGLHAMVNSVRHAFFL